MADYLETIGPCLKNAYKNCQAELSGCGFARGWRNPVKVFVRELAAVMQREVKEGGMHFFFEKHSQFIQGGKDGTFKDLPLHVGM